MAQIDIVFGLAMVAFILFYVAFKFNDIKDEEGHVKHPWIQTFLILVSFYFLILIGQAYATFNTTCDIVIANATFNGSITSYGYTQFCSTVETNVDITFFWLLNQIFYIITAYTLFYMAWDIIIKPWKKKRDKRFG